MFGTPWPTSASARCRDACEPPAAPDPGRRWPDTPAGRRQRMGVRRLVPGTHVPRPAGLRGQHPGSGAAGGHQHQRGIGARTGREHRLVARVAAGRRRTAVPPSAHAGSRREGSSSHLIGHICRDPDCSARSKALAGSETPISISANEHPLTPNDRTISWILGLARLGSVSR
jgi:hypothetical protein